MQLNQENPIHTKMRKGTRLKYRDIPVITAQPKTSLRDMPPELILQSFRDLDYISIKKFCDSSARLRRICQLDIFVSLIEAKKEEYLKRTQGYSIVSIGSLSINMPSYHLTDDEVYESTVKLIVEFDKFPSKYWKLEDMLTITEQGWFLVLKPNFPPRAKYDEIYDELLNIIALIREFGFTIKGKVLLFSLDPENAEVFEIDSSDIGGIPGYNERGEWVRIKDLRRLYGTFVPHEEDILAISPTGEVKSIGEMQVWIPEKYERDEAARRNKSQELTAMETAIDDLLAESWIWKVTMGDGGATIKLDELMGGSPKRVYPQLKRIVEFFIQSDFEVVGNIMTGWKAGNSSHLEKYEIDTPRGIPLQKSVAFFKSEYNALYGDMPPLRGRIAGRIGLYRRFMAGRRSDRPVLEPRDV